MTESFHARHQGLFDPSQLERQHVLVFGAGSVGSVLSELLVRSGIVHLRVFDFDTVSPSNLCRTVYRHADIGRPKVDVLAEVLLGIRPQVVVEPRHVDLRDLSDEELQTEIARSDLVIAATDHPPTQARLGALSYHEKPTVFVGVYAKGEGGEVLFTLPDETPCYSCVLGSIRGEHAPDRGKIEYGIATGQLASEPALGIDVAHVTTCASKVALALLLRGTGASAAQILNPSRSVLFVGNTASWIWNEPFESVWARAERRTDCVCQLVPGGSTADLLDLPGP